MKLSGSIPDFIHGPRLRSLNAPHGIGGIRHLWRQDSDPHLCRISVDSVSGRLGTLFEMSCLGAKSKRPSPTLAFGV